jgi:hypothetical protein
MKNRCEMLFKRLFRSRISLTFSISGNIYSLYSVGKTKVSTYLSEKLGLVRYGTPPERIKFLKDFFDEQRECVRRAYYSVGNYLMAQEIANTNKGLKGIILDRLVTIRNPITLITIPNLLLPHSWNI